MMSELKPCPSCGGSARIFRKSGRVGTACPSRYYRERVSCVAKRCGFSTKEFSRPNQAAKAWNTRTPDPRVMKLVEAARKLRRHVLATNQAEHMMDGFGPRRHQPSDEDLANLDAALSAFNGDGK